MYILIVRINSIIWKNQFKDKIEHKHGIFADEVEEIIFTKPLVRKVEKGNVKGEDLYHAYGKTEDGRFISVFFIKKPKSSALPISARVMSSTDKRYYENKKKKD